MNPITIRFVVPEDLASVETLMKQVQTLHVDWRPDIYRPCEPLMTAEELKKMAEEKTMLVAETEGQVVALAAFLFKHIESPNHVTRNVLFVDTMVVDADCRGQGIGRSLFAVLRELASEKQLDGIELQVNAKNKEAYEIYKQCGFREKSINMELLT